MNTDENSAQGSIETILGTSSPLAKVMKDYRPRPGQLQLAQTLLTAMAQNQSTFAEAGTGTGKSLAYLSAAYLLGENVVISTATKTLQDQLVLRDIPVLEAALREAIPHQLLKGRANYLCWNRGAPILGQGQFAFSEYDDAIQKIRAWAENTLSGDGAELGANRAIKSIWPQVSATHEQCTHRRCPDYERCFVTQARRAASEAQIVVVNHHLYFADLSLRATDPKFNALLPPHRVVIFDEAHEVPEIASAHLELSLHAQSCAEMIRLCLESMSDDKRAFALVHGPASGFELSLHRLCQHFCEFGHQVRLPKERVRALGQSPAAQEMFRHLSAFDRSLYDSAHPDAASWCHQLEQFRIRALATLRCSDQLESDTALGAWLKESPTAFASFAVHDPKNNKLPTLTLRPINAGQMMARHFKDQCAIFTSATLATGNSFEYIQSETGFRDTNTHQFSSPFDYSKQAALFLPDDAPDPQDIDYFNRLEKLAGALIKASGGGALVLCTSHRHRALLAKSLKKHASLVLTQEDSAQHELLRRFESHGNAVLVGALGLWRGVDVAGSALRLVIIDRIPFVRPDDPMLQQREEHLKTLGQNAFGRYQIPNAALLLKQAMGRLIRKEDDQGMVAILDGRIQSRGYGKKLLKSLPEMQHIRQMKDAQSYLKMLNTAHMQNRQPQT